jgi:5'-nucleotidase
MTAAQHYRAASWPQNFQHRSMVDTAIELSKELRDPEGPHKVDLIIALTHCRLPNVGPVM